MDAAFGEDVDPGVAARAVGGGGGEGVVAGGGVVEGVEVGSWRGEGVGEGEVVFGRGVGRDVPREGAKGAAGEEADALGHCGLEGAAVDGVCEAVRGEHLAQAEVGG